MLVQIGNPGNSLSAFVCFFSFVDIIHGAPLCNFLCRLPQVLLKSLTMRRARTKPGTTQTRLRNNMKCTHATSSVCTWRTPTLVFVLQAAAQISLAPAPSHDMTEGPFPSLAASLPEWRPAGKFEMEWIFSPLGRFAAGTRGGSNEGILCHDPDLFKTFRASDWLGSRKLKICIYCILIQTLIVVLLTNLFSLKSLYQQFTFIISTTGWSVWSWKSFSWQ